MKFKFQNPLNEKISDLSFGKSPHPPFAKEGDEGGITNFRRFADGETATDNPFELWI
jgi:hypothetical protein